MGEEFRQEMGLLSESELAAIIQVKPHTLAVWRVRKRGPAFVRLGKRVFYRRTDVENWIAAQCNPTDQHTPEPENQTLSVRVEPTNELVVVGDGEAA